MCLTIWKTRPYNSTESTLQKESSLVPLLKLIFENSANVLFEPLKKTTGGFNDSSILVSEEGLNDDKSSGARGKEGKSCS